MLEKFEIIPAKTTEDFEAAKNLFEEYARSLNFDLAFQNFDHEMSTINIQYARPRGVLLLIKSNDNKFVGCVGIRSLGDNISELKRMYLIPQARGKGLGRLLLDKAIVQARELGYEYLRLDTVPSMKSAIHLYKKVGFQEIPSYRYNPDPGTLYLELRLSNGDS